MSESKEVAKVDAKVVGRNEPCPCGSRKKYKRCCGVGAAPKLSEPKYPEGYDPSAPNPMANMDPQMMTQVTQAIQRLPKGQLQRLQGLMQRAMQGADVTADAEAFEKTLPPEFKELMQNWQSSMGGAASQNPENETTAVEKTPSAPLALTSQEPSSEMTVEEARKVIEKAAQEGRLSQEQADDLLTVQTPEAEKTANKFGKFWNKFSAKK